MFKFRLQKLLDIRKSIEDECIGEFKKAQSEKIQVENRLKSLKESYKKYSIFKTGESVIERKIKHTYLTAVNYSINETTGELTNKEKQLEEKRKELQLRQIERKTVEILKEKQQQFFDKEEQQVEQKNNDEFALYGFMRTRTLEGGEIDEC